MVLTNSSEISKDLVLQQRRHPSNGADRNGNEHSTNGSGNDDESDEQMEIVATNGGSDLQFANAATSNQLQQQQPNRVQFNADIICHHGEIFFFGPNLSGC